MTSDVLATAAQNSDSVNYAVYNLVTAMCGVFLLLVYTIVTIWQAHLTRAALTETRKSNEATKESNRIAELGRRSWLIVRKWDLPGSIMDRKTEEGNYSVSSEVWLRNVGGVPAIVKSFGWNWICGELPARLVLPDGKPDATIIFGENEARHFYFSRTFNMAECNQIADRGTEPLHVYWIIEYSDCLGKSWRTTKCWRRDRFTDAWNETAEPQYNSLE